MLLNMSVGVQPSRNPFRNFKRQVLFFFQIQTTVHRVIFDDGLGVWGTAAVMHFTCDSPTIYLSLAAKEWSTAVAKQARVTSARGLGAPHLHQTCNDSSPSTLLKAQPRQCRAGATTVVPQGLGMGAPHILSCL